MNIFVHLSLGTHLEFESHFPQPDIDSGALTHEPPCGTSQALRGNTFSMVVVKVQLNSNIHCPSSRSKITVSFSRFH